MAAKIKKMEGWNNLKPWLTPTASLSFFQNESQISAVLVLLVDAPEGAYTLLTKRTQSVPTHKGQVSFPGGRMQKGDSSLEATALREAQEEVGLVPEGVLTLGFLPPVQTRFQMRIHPLVAQASHPLVLRPHPGEVERILVLPLQELLQKGLKEGIVEIEGLRIKSPLLYLEGETVWGATASILLDLCEVLSKRG